MKAILNVPNVHELDPEEVLTKPEELIDQKKIEEFAQNDEASLQNRISDIMQNDELVTEGEIDTMSFLKDPAYVQYVQQELAKEKGTTEPNPLVGLLDSLNEVLARISKGAGNYSVSTVSRANEDATMLLNRDSDKYLTDTGRGQLTSVVNETTDYHPYTIIK